MRKTFCDICKKEVVGGHMSGIFYMVGQPFKIQQELDFCGSCYRILTEPKKAPIRPDISGMELTITDEREPDRPVTAGEPVKEPEPLKTVRAEKKSTRKEKTELLIPVTEEKRKKTAELLMPFPEEKKKKKKMGRPKKEKPEGPPEPDAPEEGEERKYIDYGKMLALYKAGWKIEDIADDVHCGKSTVYNYIAKLRKEGKLE